MLSWSRARNLGAYTRPSPGAATATRPIKMRGSLLSKTLAERASKLSAIVPGARDHRWVRCRYVKPRYTMVPFTRRCPLCRESTRVTRPYYRHRSDLHHTTCPPPMAVISAAQALSLEPPRSRRGNVQGSTTRAPHVRPPPVSLATAAQPHTHGICPHPDAVASRIAPIAAQMKHGSTLSAT